MHTMQVLGKPQCQKIAKLSTPLLTEAIMKYLKAPPNQRENNMKSTSQ